MCQKQPEWQAIAELVKNLQPHPQLDQRIAELEKDDAARPLVPARRIEVISGA